MTRAFDDWKLRADETDLLETAVRYGAALKRAGREHIGPCPYCGGRDRFSINPQKRKWFCRGSGGGAGPVSMVMHIAGLSFLQACEELTGEQCPTGKATPISDEVRAKRDRQKLASEAAERRRIAEEAAYQEDTKEAAQRIFAASMSPLRTIAEKYLNSRGAPTPDEGWPDCLRFHPALPYPKKPGTYPALVCCVDDMSGDLCAVWRIFLRVDGRKLDVENAKLGLGPAGGGAVRIGGTGRKIGLAEGVESALGAWNLIGQRYPVWAALSTAGLIGIEMPLSVEHVTIFPDGDHSMRKKDGEYVPSMPAGRKAAETLRARLLSEGIACTIAAEPPPGKDYADLWLEHLKEDA